MGKFSKNPLENTHLSGKENEIKSFIKGANAIPSEINLSEFPWNDLDDIEKTKGINLRLTKADLSKLNYISDNTPYSIQKFVYELVKNGIEIKIGELVTSKKL